MNRNNRKQLAHALAVGMAWTGITALLRARRRARGDHRVFILDYHEVAAGPAEPEGVVTAARFRGHLRFLKRHFDIVSLSDAVERLAVGGRLERDSLAITLDDGYLGNYRHAFEALRAEEVPATIFVATGFIDGTPLWTDLARRLLQDARLRPLPEALTREIEVLAPGWRSGATDPVEALKQRSPADRDVLIDGLVEACGMPDGLAEPMTWRQIAEMSAAGMEIGCHTMTHPILPTLSAAEQRREIAESRSRIEAEIGVPPTLFAYPNGDFNDDSIDAVRELGFVAACTTQRGSNVPGCDRFRLARIGIGADSNQLLGARLAGILDHQRRERLQDLGLVRSPVAHA